MSRTYPTRHRRGRVGDRPGRRGWSWRRARQGCSETHHAASGEFDLRQRALTEAERIAEVARVFVVQHGHLVSNVRSHADRVPAKVLDSATKPERELGF